MSHPVRRPHVLSYRTRNDPQGRLQLSQTIVVILLVPWGPKPWRVAAEDGDMGYSASSEWQTARWNSFAALLTILSAIPDLADRLAESSSGGSECQAFAGSDRQGVHTGEWPEY